MGLDAELTPVPPISGTEEAIECGEVIHVEIVRANDGDSENAE